MGLRGIDLPMFSARSANGRKSLYRNDRTHAPAGTFRKDGESFSSGAARIAGDHADAVGSAIASKSVPVAQIACITTACWTMWHNSPWLRWPRRAWLDTEDDSDGIVGDLDALDECADDVALGRPISGV